MHKKLLNVTLHGLPELEHFPTPQDRQNAIDELGAEAGNPKTLSFWCAIAVLVAAALFSRWASGWLLNLVLLPRWLEDILRTVGMVGGFLVVLRWLHRSGTAAELRRKLLANGVPVCIKCGYLLRGLGAQSKRCPECGTDFSPRVEELLARNLSLPRGPENGTPTKLKSGGRGDGVS